MSTREETRQLRLAAWKQIFADHAASGLSVRAYCEANNIKRDQYFYWQSIARKAALAGMRILRCGGAASPVWREPPVQTD